MLSCKDASRLISQSLDRRLTLRERFGLRVHLMICDFCSRFRQQVELIRAAIKRMTGQIEQDEHLVIPPEAKTRIADAIKSRHEHGAHNDERHDH